MVICRLAVDAFVGKALGLGSSTFIGEASGVKHSILSSWPPSFIFGRSRLEGEDSICDLLNGELECSVSLLRRGAVPLSILDKGAAGQDSLWEEDIFPEYTEPTDGK